MTHLFTTPLCALASAWGALTVSATTIAFSRGRQLRERGAPIFAKLVMSDSWIDGEAIVDAPAAVARAWRENGKTEHASVAAFAKLASELVALGAPATLIQNAHEDALDEIRHARLCFSLAHAIDGHQLSPASLPAPATAWLPQVSRTARLARLAIEALVDGALNEGTSARTVARLVKRVDEPAVRHVLVAIAGDEGRHAAHGFDVLAWCLAEGGAVVRAAVEGGLRALPASIGKPHAAAADATDATDGSFERYGIAGTALQQSVYAEVRAAVVARVRALLGSPPSSSPSPSSQLLANV